MNAADKATLEQRLDVAMADLDNAMIRLAAIEAAIPFHRALAAPPPKPLGPDVPGHIAASVSNALIWGDACYAQREFIVKALRAMPPGARAPIRVGMTADVAAWTMLNWIIDLIESGDYPHA